ncbi:MAG: hypothetical protein ACPG5U_04310 [Planktomarina sp.]
MEILKTALRTFGKMWMMFALLAVGIGIIEQLLDSTALVGAQLVIYTMLVYMAHSTILSGDFSMIADKSNPMATNPFTLKFALLILGVIGVPVLVGVIAPIFLFPETVAIFGPNSLIIFGAIAVWISLIFFGHKIPHHVWGKVMTDRPLIQNDVKHDRAYTAFWLVVWNVLTFVFIIAVSLGLWALLRPIVPSLSVLDIVLRIVGSFFGYFTITITAAVLSHAHFRSYGIEPQGLIHKL